MKYLTLFLLLMPIMAFTYDWDSWQDRCTDNFYHDFTIYGSNSSYRSASGMLVVDMEPKLDVLDYVPLYSQGDFAGFRRPLIPSFNYPSTIPLHISNNYTFYSPFGYSDNDYLITVVANNSEGKPRCSQLQWRVNDSIKFQDEKLTIATKVTFNASLGKFEYTLTNQEDTTLRVYVSVFSGTTLMESTSTLLDPKGGGKEEVSKTSKLTYRSIDVSAGLYDVYVVSSTRDKSFYEKFKLFEFYDFNMTIPKVPNFRPGDSYSSTLLLKNTGYKTDSYDVGVNMPEGWSFTLSGDLQDINGGQETEVILKYTVPELQIGPSEIKLNVTSLGSNTIKHYVVKLNPEKITTLEVSTRNLEEIQAYSNNNVSVVVLSSGTISPKMYYYAYTEPALLMRKGTGTMTATVGNINKRTLDFEVGGSCAMSDPNSMAFNAGRKTLMLGNAIYYLTSELSEENIATLVKIKDIIEAEKLKMTSDDATKLFSSADRLSLLIDRFLDGWSENKGNEYFRSLREDLYLFLVDFDNTLSDVGNRMSESCSSVDSVEFHLFAIDLSTLQYRNVPQLLPVKGPKVIEFIGPSKVKAISGTSIYLEYILKNNAGEGFEVEMEPSSDIVIPPAFVYLPADSQKKVEIKIRPPKYFEVEDLKVNVKIKTRTYNINFPLTVSVGPFDPKIIVNKEYAVSPGVEKYFNITLQTGGLDDTFKVSLDGPNWVSLPERVATENGEATMSLVISPPSSGKGSETIGVSVYSESFSDYFFTKSFDIFINSEADAILSRLNEDLLLLEEKKDLLSEKQYVKANRLLSAARTDINQVETTSAKLNLNKAETILFSVSKSKGVNWKLYVAIGILVASLIVFWKFLLPKMRGSPSPKEQEVI